MAFSLSPSVDVREFDLSLTVPNLPSSKTGMVLRANQGPAMKIVQITNERELVDTFGKPTAYNYQDWFQAWNFLQYASSLYIVRPMDTAVANAGLEITGGVGTIAKETVSADELYNQDVAELTLESMTPGADIAFYNKEVTADEKLCFAICSSNDTWTKPIFSAVAPGFVLFTADGTATDGSAYASIQVDGSNCSPVGSTFAYDGTTYTITGLVADDMTVSPSFTAPIYSSGATPILPLTVPAPVAPTGKFDESVESATGVFRSFNAYFDYKPDFAAGQFAVVVFEKNQYGLYEYSEAFTCSSIAGSRDEQGRNIFVEKVFFEQSKKLYAKVLDNTAALNVNSYYGAPLEIVNDGTITMYPLTAGAYDPKAYAPADINNAFDLFGDPEVFDVNILITHELSMNQAATVAMSRKDCFAVVAPYEYGNLVGKSPSAATQWMIQEFGSTTFPMDNMTFNNFTNYAAIYGNMKYQYDKFNDVNRWLCVAGDIAGLAAQTDANRDPWWAIAGMERGKMKNVIKLAFNPNKANRDDLYVNAINPVIGIAGEGAGVVFGQKTATAKPSAFDRLNVRRLLIVLEKAIASAARYMLFEFNDEFTRARIRGLIDPFLRDVKGRRGLYDFLVVCDDSNNTPEVIDKNALVIDVYLKPTKVAEFIQINMKVTRTDANFQELVGKP